MVENIKELSAAMAKAFSDITGAGKDKKNAHLNYEYASLNSIIEAIKPSITQHGLWFYQVIHTVQGCAAVETIIMHSSGESLSCGVVTVPVQKQDAQGFGSALTYARKYSLSSAFGVAPEDDDDGEKACKPPKKDEKKFEENIERDERIIPRDDLIKMLIVKTGLLEEKFKEYLAYFEKRCIEKKISFYNMIKKSLDDTSGIVKGYNDWKAQDVSKKELETAVA